MESILTSVKKNLGIDEEYEHFDPDLILYINSIFSVLNQMGVGPSYGFSITDCSAAWDDFVSDDKICNLVKSYMILKVRMMFDPPQSSSVVNVYNELIKEYESRLNIMSDIE